MPDATVILNGAAIQRALSRIAHEIAERNDATGDLVVIGVQRGGVHLAQRLGRLLGGLCGNAVPVGQLDVGMHRDDLDHHLTPQIQPTVIPFHITGKIVVLVDDVLFSGRTTRAALDALTDFGRPKSIQLVVLVDDVLFSGRTTRAALDALNDFGRPRCVQFAVLIDRGHRELPIKADFVGKNVPTSLRERINVRLQEDGGEDLVTLEKK